MPVTEASERPRRLLDIFPPGFDSRFASSSRRGHYPFAPEQLYRILTENYDPEKHVESTLVTSVWYGKQKRGLRHEFLLVKVEDTVAGLQNVMVLDRNINSTDAALDRNKLSSLNSRQIRCGCQGEASDTFRISYNGIQKQLLTECQLCDWQYLEMIEFAPHQQLFLYELVTLVDIISANTPRYGVIGKNCYWFAGIIWECLRTLCPAATHDPKRANLRGRFANLRYTPNAGDVAGICDEYRTKIEDVDRELQRLRQRWQKMEAQGSLDPTA